MTKPKKSNTPEFIHQYVLRNVNGQRKTVGVLVGKLVNGRVKIGWSKANTSLGDSFDKKFGLNLALERTKADDTVPLPHSMKKDGYRFQDRCCRYFKDACRGPMVVIQPIKLFK